MSLSDLENVVCSLQFVYNKCTIGLATSLMDDYQPIGKTTIISYIMLKF